MAVLVAVVALIIACSVVIGFASETRSPPPELRVRIDDDEPRHVVGPSYPTTDWLTAHRWLPPEPRRFEYEYEYETPQSDWLPMRSQRSPGPSGYSVRTPGGSALPLL